jgi:outer membrane protein TolC
VSLVVLAREAVPQEPAAAPSEPSRASTLSLAQAVSLALTQNFSLLSASDSERAARFNESAVRADFYPKLTPRLAHSSDDTVVGLELAQRVPWSGAQLSLSGVYRSLRDESATPLPRTSDVRVTLTQPLLRGFGPNATHFDVVNARRARQAQERSLELSRQRLAIDVTAAFYQVLRQRQLIEVSRQSLERSEGLRDASQARMQVGLASRLDVLRAELQAAQAGDALVSAETALAGSLERFRFLLGLPPSEPVEPEGSALPDLEAAEPQPLAALVAEALAKRLELMEARDQVGDADRALRLAGQNLLPQLDLNLSHQRLGAGSDFGSAFRGADGRTTFFVSSSYPVERAADRAARAVARLSLDAATRALQQRQFEIEADVREAVRALERIRKSVDLQRQSVDLAEQQQRLATLRYQRGLASNFDVVDAEASLVGARTALVGLLADYQVARMQLLRATGALDVEKEFAP